MNGSPGTRTGWPGISSTAWPTRSAPPPAAAPPGAALARFRLGLRAAVLLVPGDARLLAAGTAFVDEFPEFRYV